MSNLGRHVLVPLLASLGMVALYLAPTDLIGCANRGLAAFALAIVSSLGSLVMAGATIARRLRSRDEALWFVVSAALLLMPALLLLGPLG